MTKHVWQKKTRTKNSQKNQICYMYNWLKAILQEYIKKQLIHIRTLVHQKCIQEVQQSNKTQEMSTFHYCACTHVEGSSLEVYLLQS